MRLSTRCSRANINMRTIKGGYKHTETFPLPCWRDSNKVLQYDSTWADELVCRIYGEDQTKYEVHPSTLELYYNVSKKMRFKVAEITYESYYTDIKGQEWEQEWMDTWVDINKSEGSNGKAEDYEMYNLTLFHYDHPALKSKLLQDGELKGINSYEYIKGVMERIERGEIEPPIDRLPEDEDEWFDDGDDYYK